MGRQAEELAGRVEELAQAVERELRDRLPRKVGVLARQHFRDNFRQSGFVDGGLQRWQKAQREQGRSTSARYRTLTSSRNHLMNSIEAAIRPSEVVITNPVPYATIHNEGGTLESAPRVTPRMKRFFWARYYAAGGKKGGGEADKWKRLALTTKDTLRIKVRMPRRQFIGESRELRERIDREILSALNRLSERMR